MAGASDDEGGGTQKDPVIQWTDSRSKWLLEEVIRQIELGRGTDSAGWNNETQHVDMSPDQWKTYIDAHSDVKQFEKRAFPFLELMGSFMGKEHQGLPSNIIGTGAPIPSPPSNQHEPADDEEMSDPEQGGVSVDAQSPQSPPD
ncbi:uncharacterized protein MELLADRAFT_116450 [Melampsora larici-populina 98AG31]|uniref:Myb/SANT-like domain-containing protein n=1 Tax=Melampsora larici-populina (strain 98AG31 / pathotype 3-4-7) TaxID=747676 RepID=F4RLB6_MELLP|nr:uncharacterized protein MELLADRAFT_116450 [Melampsora larici-populina 98AG31]EGG06881.1 hypothetical protein MELLADRAFT_116450 [Melampsora larici-populina 98AG31]